MIDEELDLDLMQAALAIAGLDIDDAELVVEELALVVRVEDLDLADRRGEFRAEHSVKEVDQQGAVGLSTEQGLEDAVDLGGRWGGAWLKSSRLVGTVSRMGGGLH